ncbi:uncharacterized protein LOC103507469 [Diaphorina citri]|uniref:Uncharacterized protein LOC103507469 n=1 Tax=Diaphorina citri TaxID=121845 RepID=A0A3Q0IUC7_DIACI|nr:uncharacterized protein LOC103507469 [Diaphorina citri]
MKLGKYLGASDLDKLANVRVLNITNFGDVRFQFVCSKQDGSKARDVFNKLVERGKLQHFVLVTTKMSFKQHSSLVLKGTSTTNVDSLERVSSLHIDSVVRGDAGVYSCHLGDWTSQQCRPVGVSVSESAPDVYLDPLSLTVEVGSRVQLKCVALNELRAAQKFGYSWTKNKKLFRNDPAHEIWEELSPGGSLLTVLNIQDTSTYTCHVHGAFASVAKSLTIYVRRPSLHPLTCLPDSTPGNVGSQIPWPETLSDVTAIQDVYYGTLGNSALNRQVKQRPGCLVTRRCSLVGTRAEWRLPDFSKCATPAMLKIRNNLEKLSLNFKPSFFFK